MYVYYDTYRRTQTYVSTRINKENKPKLLKCAERNIAA